MRYRNWPPSGGSCLTILYRRDPDAIVPRPGEKWTVWPILNLWTSKWLSVLHNVPPLWTAPRGQVIVARQSALELQRLPNVFGLLGGACDALMCPAIVRVAGGLKPCDRLLAVRFSDPYDRANHHAKPITMSAPNAAAAISRLLDTAFSTKLNRDHVA